MSLEEADVTQSPDTRRAYTRRCRQLEKAALRTLAGASGQPLDTVLLTPALFVDYVIGRKGKYAANSWRLVRRSVVWTLEEDASRAVEAFANEIWAALARLRDEKADPDDPKKAATSRNKAKALSHRDRTRIERSLLAKRSKFGGDLARYLRVGTVTGLRPCEWPMAQLLKSDRPGFRWMLVVANAKFTNGRAHGPTRALYWDDLPPEVVCDITAWIAVAREPGHDVRLNTIGRLLWEITRELWPSRKEHPTLYSTRHAAVAVWKAHFLRANQTVEERLAAMATIAALMGHGSDDTASRHYARAGAASSGNLAVGVPAADPAQVARVRKVYDPNWREIVREKKDKTSQRVAPEEMDTSFSDFIHRLH